MRNRIQELRKERRVTQNELADAVDVSRQTIISLENGRYNASLQEQKCSRCKSIVKKIRYTIV